MFIWCGGKIIKATVPGGASEPETNPTRLTKRERFRTVVGIRLDPYFLRNQQIKLGASSSSTLRVWKQAQKSAFVLPVPKSPFDSSVCNGKQNQRRDA